MIKKFIKNEKWKDYFKFSESECIFSLIVSLCMLAFVCWIEMYEKFEVFINPINNILLYIIAGFFGLLGFSLSGIAIVTGLFSREHMRIIKKSNNEEKIEKILLSFQFLSFNLALGIFFSFLLDFLIFSEKNLVSVYVFYLIFFIYSYFVFFNIFYTVSLVGNCISLYKIKNLYDDIELERTTLIELLNDVRIDFILAQIGELRKKDPKDIVEELIQTVKQSSIEEKETLLKYLEEHYKE